MGRINIIQVYGERLSESETAGAVGAIVLDISKELAKLGHNVTILSRKHPEDNSNVEYLHGVKIIRLKVKKFNPMPNVIMGGDGKFVYLFESALNMFLFSLQVKRYLSGTRNVDVIHAHMSIIGITLAILNRSLRCKLIYTSHSARRLMDSPGFLDRFALLPENMLVRRVKKVIALNEEARRRLIVAAGIGEETVVTIPFGIDTGKFSLSSSGDDIKRMHGLNGKRIILFVGVINERKGVEYLVKAANIVVNEYGYKDTFFLLVGPIKEFGIGEEIQTPYRDRLLNLIDNYGLEQNIRFTGFVPETELVNFYSMCNIFVLPSLAEALPKVVMEAMACGKPVIGTRVGGISMQVKNGHSGFLVDPANDRQLADRIKYLLDNPSEAEKMGICGRNFVEEEFSSTQIAQRLLQVFRSVLPKPAKKDDSTVRSCEGD